MLTLAEMERVDRINDHVRNWRSSPPVDIEWLIDKVNELQSIIELNEAQLQIMSADLTQVRVCKCQ
jgi:hypothetical protein